MNIVLNEQWTEVNVPVGACRSMNYQRPQGSLEAMLVFPFLSCGSAQVRMEVVGCREVSDRPATICEKLGKIKDRTVVSSWAREMFRGNIHRNTTTGLAVVLLGPQKSTTHLKRVMAVIPRMPVLQGLPLVGKTITLGNWTLRDSVDTVHLVRVQLTNSVPVYRSSVLVIIVPNVYDEFVSPAGLDLGAWETLIEDLAGCFLESVCGELYRRNQSA